VPLELLLDAPVDVTVALALPSRAPPSGEQPMPASSVVIHVAAPQ